MPGKILTTASQIKCAHGGTVTLTTSNTTLKIDGMPALLESDMHTVAGCAFTLPGPKPSPCVKIEWSLGAVMCKVNDTAVLIETSVGKCSSAEGVVQGVAIVAQKQMKVEAT